LILEAVFKSALKEQFHASLAMLKESVELTPAELWLAGDMPRTTWRIALHAAFFAQLGLSGSLENYRSWPGRPDDLYSGMWEDPAGLEPFELDFIVPAISRADVIRYIDYVSGQVETLIDCFDLKAAESGMPGYSPMTAVSAFLMNLRDLQGHVGQISERLLTVGIEPTWIGMGSMTEWKAWEEANP
jgi:hypothetical protein